jgi:hypothetical protein
MFFYRGKSDPCLKTLVVMKHLALLIISTLALAACATTGSTNRPLALQKLASTGVDPAVVKKMENGRVLTYSDILILVKAQAPQQMMISYLKSTKAPYRFTTAQLEGLSDAGAGSDLVNYLGKSVGYYQATQRSQTGGSKWDNHPYFTDPYYLGDAPFPYAFPDEWEDPAMVGMWF